MTDRLDRLTNLMERMMPDGANDGWLDFRDLLISEEDAYDTVPVEIIEAVDDLDPAELAMIRLEYDLCPIHHVDYAICQDDDDPECREVRGLINSGDYDIHAIVARMNTSEETR